tara:strand:+ start:954 stop:1130 length:177 start_codon:yes stop_codon:yes gene_type:complete
MPTKEEHCFTKLHRVVIEFGMKKVLEVLPTFFSHKAPLPHIQQVRLKLEEARDLYDDA